MWTDSRDTPLQTLRRIIAFCGVGGAVSVLSFVQLWLYVSVIGMGYWIAYTLQTIVSIELNYWGNYLTAWRDRRNTISIWGSQGKFWITRLPLALINLAIFPLLATWLHHYMIAQLVIIVVNTVLNYILSDRFVFKKVTRETIS